MSIRIDDTLPEVSLDFLKRCYKFVNQEWQHAVREPIPDQGFEQRFRESCVISLPGWNISQQREMHLGYGLDTASGVSHEVDIVAQHSDVTAILEIKNRQGFPPEKNDVIVFFAKVFDYLALNPSLLLKEIILAFMSNTAFEASGLAACLGLGIHPVAPGLRPLPILIDNAKRMDVELQKGIFIAPNVVEQFEDFCAQLNRTSSTLSETWLSNRCGYYSEDRIVLKAIGGLPTLVLRVRKNITSRVFLYFFGKMREIILLRTLSQELRLLNSDCLRLLDEFKKAKSRAMT